MHFHHEPESRCIALDFHRTATTSALPPARRPRNSVILSQALILCHLERSEAPAERSRKTPLRLGSHEKQICISSTNRKAVYDSHRGPRRNALAGHLQLQAVPIELAQAPPHLRLAFTNLYGKAERHWTSSASFVPSHEHSAAR